MDQRVSVAESVRVKTYVASCTPLARSQPPTAKASYAFTTLQRRAASAALPAAAMQKRVLLGQRGVRHTLQRQRGYLQTGHLSESARPVLQELYAELTVLADSAGPNLGC